MQQKYITAKAFAQLGKEKQLHEYSEVIFKLMGVVIDFISAEQETLKLSRGVNFNEYCSALRSIPEGKEACRKCDVSNALIAAKKRQPICYTCHAGMIEVLVPLFDHAGKYIGSMTSGQFHLAGNKLLGKSEVKAIAEKYRLDAGMMYRAYRSSLALTSEQLDGLIGYLQIIGRHLSSKHDNLIFMDKINTPNKIDEIKKHIEKNYMKRLSIQQVAKVFYMSPGYLAHVFKKEINIPFNNYLNSFRIAKAKEMLDDTELSVSEIAFMCGFGSISQFNRSFHSITDSTPSQYRNKD